MESALILRSNVDEKFYEAFNPDVCKTDIEAFEHFARFGFAEDRDPHPLFSSKYYRKLFGTVIPPGENPFAHYLKNAKFNNPSLFFDTQYSLSQFTDGCANPLQTFLESKSSYIKPHPLFDSQYYIENNEDVRLSKINPLVHFVLAGRFEGRSPHPLFDTAYYFKQLDMVPIDKVSLKLDGYDTLQQFYESAAALQIEDASPFCPFTHYCQNWRENLLDPHELFSTSYYLNAEPEVRLSGVNPLIYFIKFGYARGHSPHELFDADYYLTLYEDVRDSGQNAFLHYVSSGWKEGRRPNPFFDPNFYRAATNSVLRMGPLSDFAHSFGDSVRSPSANFDAQFYLKTYGDVAGEKLNPLSHYLISGAREGRHRMPVKHKQAKFRFLVVDEFTPFKFQTLRSSLLINFIESLQRRGAECYFSALSSFHSEAEARLLKELHINVIGPPQSTSQDLYLSNSAGDFDLVFFCSENLLSRYERYFETPKAKPQLMLLNFGDKIAENSGFERQISLSLFRKEASLDSRNLAFHFNIGQCSKDYNPQGLQNILLVDAFGSRQANDRTRSFLNREWVQVEQRLGVRLGLVGVKGFGQRLEEELCETHEAADDYELAEMMQRYRMAILFSKNGFIVPEYFVGALAAGLPICVIDAELDPADPLTQFLPEGLFAPRTDPMEHVIGLYESNERLEELSSKGLDFTSRFNSRTEMDQDLKRFLWSSGLNLANL